MGTGTQQGYETVNDLLNDAHISELRNLVDRSGQPFRKIFFAFLILIAYLLVVTISVSDEEILWDADLLRASAINISAVPLPDITMKVSHFFIIAPLLILIFHFSLLLQAVFLARKVSDYKKEVDKKAKRALIGVRTIRRMVLKLLSPIPLVQTLYYSAGFFRWLVWWFAYSLMIILPVAALVVVSGWFLRAQLFLITFMHWLILLADIALISSSWSREIYSELFAGDGNKRRFPALLKFVWCLRKRWFSRLSTRLKSVLRFCERWFGHLSALLKFFLYVLLAVIFFHLVIIFDWLVTSWPIDAERSRLLYAGFYIVCFWFAWSSIRFLWSFIGFLRSRKLHSSSNGKNGTGPRMAQLNFLMTLLLLLLTALVVITVPVLDNRYSREHTQTEAPNGLFKRISDCQDDPFRQVQIDRWLGWLLEKILSEVKDLKVLKVLEVPRKILYLRSGECKPSVVCGQADVKTLGIELGGRSLQGANVLSRQ